MKKIEFLTHGRPLIDEVLVDGEKWTKIRRATLTLVADKRPRLDIELNLEGTVSMYEGVEVMVDARTPAEWAEPWKDCEECQELTASNIDYTCSRHAATWDKKMGMEKRKNDVVSKWNS